MSSIQRILDWTSLYRNSHSLRIYEMAKQMLRNDNVKGEEYENAVKKIGEILKI